MNKNPLAYFITFRTYGSWLHGDTRLSVDRYRNQYGTPRIQPNIAFKTSMQSQQKQSEIVLSKEHGNIILDAITFACQKYEWHIFALHIRTNHVHLTVKSNRTPDHVTTQVKAYSTRFLREHNAFSRNLKIWSRGFSVKYIWTPKSLYYASEYVIEHQGQKIAYCYGDLFETM